MKLLERGTLERSIRFWDDQRPAICLKQEIRSVERGYLSRLGSLIVHGLSNKELDVGN